MPTLVPKKIFLTKGVGRHKERLASFELALRDAGIEAYNLVTVSSIFPPRCKVVSKKRIRIIAPKGVKITLKEAAEARNANAEIRKSDHVIFDLMIADTDDVIIGVPDPLSEEINHAIAIWVSNPSFAGSTRNAVEEIWKSADRV